MAVVQLQARRFSLPHQLMVVGGDDYRGPEPVELNPALPGCYTLATVRDATEDCLADRSDFNPSNISVHVIAV